MILHFFDAQNRQKINKAKTSDLASFTLEFDIEDFHTVQFSFVKKSRLAKNPPQGLQCMYVEDEDGRVVFGGIITEIQSDGNRAYCTAFDFRFVLKRAVNFQNNYEVDSAPGAFIENIMDDNRELGLIQFDRDRSVLPDVRIQASFERGEDFASIVKKVMEITNSHWGIYYQRYGQNFLPFFYIRTLDNAVATVGKNKTQSGVGEEKVLLKWREGSLSNNIVSFTLKQNFSDTATRVYFGFQNRSGETRYVFSDRHEGNTELGRLERRVGRITKYQDDYDVNEEATAIRMANDKVVFPQLAVKAELKPKTRADIAVGDLVTLDLEDSLQELGKRDVRVDNVSYKLAGGVFETRVELNSRVLARQRYQNGIVEQITNTQSDVSKVSKRVLNS